MTITLLILMALLAFANGGNDNCKGVATLVGYGAAKPGRALWWAMVTTALGAGFSFWFAGGLVKSFSAGLFAAGTPLDTAFFIAVLAGAFGWVILATVTGLPVSTTHAIAGGLVGAGLVAFGLAPIEWGYLGARFAIPLALSPLISLGIVYLASWPVVSLLQRITGRCACVTAAPDLVPSPGGAAAVRVQIAAVTADEEECEQRANLVAVPASRVLDTVHWLSSGMVGFARGWNDAPKIAALGVLVLGGESGMAACFAIVSVSMALGGMVAGRRVLETLSQKVTTLPLAESLTASIATAAMVGMASWSSLPVSTTHVSTGAIVGAGLRHDAAEVKWGKVGEIALSWLVTLPAAALIAGLVKLLVR